MPKSFTLNAPEPLVAESSIVESSTVASTSSAATVIPSPPTTFKVASPAVAPPVKPLPAIILVISPSK